jgi:AcrR family transcriptional regulator
VPYSFTIRYRTVVVGKGRRLGRDDWAEAALAALAEGGLAAVAVEPLAARLGATKGSFYWHFANRSALQEAAVLRWEERHTEAVIASLAGLPDPAERLRRLFDTVFRTGETGADGGEAGGDGDTSYAAELALLADAEHPLVAPVLARVTARRIGWMTANFAELGCGPAEARHRAVLAYTAFIGLIQARRASGGTLLADGGERGAYLDFLYRSVSWPPPG